MLRVRQLNFHNLKVRRAFTTIELLTAIGILVVLVGIVFMGYRSIVGGSKLRATHVTLENCRALVAEREAVSGLGAGPGSWLYANGLTTPPVSLTTVSPPDPAANDLNYWKVPYRNPLNPSGAALPIEGPSLVKDDPAGFNVRNGNHVITNTTLMLSLLAAVPANRSAISKLGKEQLFTPEWVSVPYPIGARVKWNTAFYIATANVPAGTTPATSPPWIVDSTPVPIIRDGWGNPIIFVPASGLFIYLKADQSDYIGAASQNYIVISPEGQVNGNGTATPVVARIGRPFFASAGPDGDFSKGDDNVYSFEK